MYNHLELDNLKKLNEEEKLSYIFREEADIKNEFMHTANIYYI